MVEEFLSKLLQQGFEFWTQGGELRYRAPKGALTDSLRGDLSRY